MNVMQDKILNSSGGHSTPSRPQVPQGNNQGGFQWILRSWFYNNNNIGFSRGRLLDDTVCSSIYNFSRS